MNISDVETVELNPNVEPSQKSEIESNVESITPSEAAETNVESDDKKELTPNVEPIVEMVSADTDVESEAFVDEEDLDEDLNFNLDQIDNILDLDEDSYPRFTLAKNKARFLRMVNWYRAKEEWIDVAPLSGVSKLFKQQSKELEGIRANKLDYEMELETGTLTPSQRSYKKDELKMCKVQEKMAVHLITKLQKKIKSGRR